MSKDIIIQEGGSAKTLGNVAKLRTNINGGGSCLWVPEDGVALGSITITDNGTYRASTEGYYGYSEVRVNIPNINSTTGKGADGNVYKVTTDSAGIIVQTKLSSSIVVTTLPNVTAYSSGDQLDFEGIEVTAYDANGTSMGTVPFGELVFPVTQSDISQAQSESSATSDLATNWEQPIPIFDEIWQEAHDSDGKAQWKIGNWSKNGGIGLCIKLDDRNRASIWAGKTEEAVAIEKYSGSTYDVIPTQSWTYGGKTVWWGNGLGGSGSGFNYTYYPTGFEDGRAQPDAATIWTAVYGTVIERGSQIIPVCWNRHGDGELLTTSFVITITQSFGGAEGGGGQAGEGGAGRND